MLSHLWIGPQGQQSGLITQALKKELRCLVVKLTLPLPELRVVGSAVGALRLPCQEAGGAASETKIILAASNTSFPPDFWLRRLSLPHLQIPLHKAETLRGLFVVVISGKAATTTPNLPRGGEKKKKEKEG